MNVSMPMLMYECHTSAPTRQRPLACQWLIAQMAAQWLRNLRFQLIAEAWVQIPTGTYECQSKLKPYYLLQHVVIKKPQTKHKYSAQTLNSVMVESQTLDAA